VVAFNLAVGSLSLVGPPFRESAPATALVFVVIQALALWWRRSHPGIVLGIVVSAAIVAWVLNPTHEPSGPALAFAVYAVSVYGPMRVRLWVAGAAIAIIIAAVILLFVRDFPTARNLIPGAALSLVAWVIGDYVRSRRQFFLEILARHTKEREQAAEEERLRIARELHDVVAHNVSVMAIQAGAARVSGSSDKEALQSIETTARDTLAELNRLLGVLRKPSDAPLAPQPGLDQVEALLKPARDAGLEANLKVTGEKRSLLAAVDLSAYRIVQEAITNVLKHANASRVEVVFDYQPDALALTVSDNGSGPQAPGSNGHGLIGMRERVALFGGEMQAGTSTLGGFTIRARLPLKT
jgi:signal transduction histidine kinase